MALNTQGQYRIVGNKITYEVAPQPGDIHEAIYFRGKRVIDGPPVSASLSIRTSLEVSDTYTPIIKSEAGKDPDWVYYWGVNNFNPLFCSLIFVNGADTDWTDRVDTADILPLPTVADLSQTLVDCAIIGTLGGSGYSRLTVHDCWMTLTYPSGGSIAVRPTTLCWTEFTTEVIHHCGLEFPLVIERTLFGSGSQASDQTMQGFSIPVG